MSKTKHELTRDSNRQAIVQAALEVFGTLGYGATSVRDIVRASGLAPGSFYNNFPNKEAVMQAVIDTFLTPLVAQLRQVRHEAPDTEEFIRNAYHTALDVARQDPAVANLIARNQTEFRQQFLQGQTRVQITKDLAEDLAAGVASGQFSPHDPEQLAEVMVSLGVDLVVQANVDASAAEQRLEFLNWLFLKTLRPNSLRREN